jgi:hypothetical protein
MTIADLKAMYDRYREVVDWYESKLTHGFVSIESMKGHKEKLQEYSAKFYNVGRQLEQEMDKAYEKEIIK